jgi:hypothetical protein
MDSFLRRLKYYGIGFGIGLVFVLFFFQNRGCSWLPSNRVKNSFLDRLIVVSDSSFDQMKEKGINKGDLISVLNDGDVNFGSSRKSGNPKVYELQKAIDGKEMKFYFTLPEESFITEVFLAETPISKVKSSTKGKGKVIHYPNDKTIIYVDSSSVLSCQLMEIGFTEPESLLSVMKKTGRIDFEKTRLEMKPKPEHYLEFKDKKGRIIGARAVWYKTKVNISSFELSYETDCDLK